MSENFSLKQPQTWTVETWLTSLAPALLVAALMFEDEEYRMTPGHQVFIGIAIIEIAAAAHVAVYPETVAWIEPAVVGLASALWAALPTVYWQPWQVTSLGGLAGVLPLGNGLRLAFTGGGA